MAFYIGVLDEKLLRHSDLLRLIDKTLTDIQIQTRKCDRVQLKVNVFEVSGEELQILINSKWRDYFSAYEDFDQKSLLLRLLKVQVNQKVS